MLAESGQCPLARVFTLPDERFGLGGGAEVTDLSGVLADLRRGISPPGPGEPGRFRPVSGSDAWLAHSGSAWELDRGRWEVIAGHEGETVWSQVEAQAIVEGVKCRDLRSYWRCQYGGGLSIELPSYEAAVAVSAGEEMGASRMSRK